MEKGFGNVIAISIPCFLLPILFGCTDAQRAKIGGYGNPHHVELYSGGQKVREWVSSGKVDSETDSDGYYFNDMKTGRLIEVSGDVVITKLAGKNEVQEVVDSLSE